MIAFRNTDVDAPFAWESDQQPPARWHAAGQGPAQYLASTPDAAWAEFCRHEEIREPEDLTGVRRTLWAVEVDDGEPWLEPDLPLDGLTADVSSYSACQAEASRLRALGTSRLHAPSAAVNPATASGWRVEHGLHPGPARPETTIVLFGPRPSLVGWRACSPGAPGPELLRRVRYL